MIRKGIRVKDFYSLGGKVYFTQADAPYEVLLYNDPKTGSYLGAPMQSVWETPWLDLGKSLKKSDFTLRFTADADDDDVPVDITIITDKREKVKTVLLQSDRRDYKVSIKNSGVRVKLRIESGAKPAGWRIYGGVQVEYSMDEV